MAAESNHVPKATHFDNGANLNKGARNGESGTQNGTTLAEMLRRLRSGVYTASGAGDEVITFSDEFETDNVTVMLASDTVAAVPILKNGTTATKSGFTVTVAAACEVHWMAIDRGPTS
jgi:hypothetical protein